MPDVDLPAYFTRIGYTGPGEPTLAVLRELHARHPARIAYENLDPFLGLPVSLDPATIEAKLVRSRRGGYCHEQNALFRMVLATIGFKVTPLAARVVWTSPVHSAPLTHSLTLVTLPEGRFICDVGFSQSPTAPLLFDCDAEQVTLHGAYRAIRDGDVSELQLGTSTGWKPMYRFNLVPQSDVDFEVANWYTSAHPRSRFTQHLIVCRVVGDTRVNLLNMKVSIRYADGTHEQRDLTNSLGLAKFFDDVMDLAPPVSADVVWAKLRLTGS